MPHGPDGISHHLVDGAVDRDSNNDGHVNLRVDREQQHWSCPVHRENQLRQAHRLALELDGTGHFEADHKYLWIQQLDRDIDHLDWQRDGYFMRATPVAPTSLPGPGFKTVTSTAPNPTAPPAPPVVTAAANAGPGAGAIAAMLAAAMAL
ncbi:hypothetical protein PLICBS_007440 [Purpureocillium lilacinum]|uniref:uncharacterized protein n=1 Tax=Purpureocillium lilacinum TaxID=33203 RepID=UPI0020808DD1|nr:hypothetical protein PLICBS_007440 [Purpureocillium lilacinum]